MAIQSLAGRMIPCPQLRINVGFSVAWFSGSCEGYVVERAWGRSVMMRLKLLQILFVAISNLFNRFHDEIISSGPERVSDPSSRI